MSTLTEPRSATLLQRPEFKADTIIILTEITPPVKGQYFDVVSPVDGKNFTQVAHSSKEDLELAVDAAEKAFQTWKNTSLQKEVSSLIKLQTE
jgi:aldehyde dehydrogenase